MTAPITDYTTYDDVRAALGVSVDDVDDTTLALNLYAASLEADLEDIDVTLPGTYATTAAIVTPTDAQSRFLQSAKLFATFAVAKQLTSALPLFAPKQVSDGKSTMDRFANPYKDVVATVNQQYDRFKNRLTQTLAAIGTTTSAATPLNFFSVVSPSTDPVTGT